MKSFYLLAWGVTRLLFLFFWAFAEPIGDVWLKGRYLAA